MGRATEPGETSLHLAQAYLGVPVRVVVDRPLGSAHPRAGFRYELNYGYLPGVTAPDGDNLDAYLVGVDTPVAEAEGVCVAVVHRLYEDDDKLVVLVAGDEPDDARLRELVHFQEGDRPYEIVRPSPSA
ncbi:inorganic pyrophosphatase [Salinispora sp. H7-4]|uniref:inorganic pyrophosphatase n=1 Tax=Salinispora sp. H7-4 TaxID=2748321 RepID=UPI0015D2472C|nr:inorganic pyrophosphatase [Salinispora sp. H7-4]NYT92306.1 inorganic pyrophosphatase [Salinispora sp. H7-4]